MNARDITALVPWSRTLEEVGADPGRGRRTRCYIHGGNNLTAFSCSDQTGKAQCYSCGWHGDKIDFLQTILGLDFKAALARLADIAGVEVSKCHRPNRLDLARATAHRHALAAARDAYNRWQREQLITLTDGYRELSAEREIREIAFRATRRRPDLYTEDEARHRETQLASIYDRLAVLEHDLDVLTFRKWEPERLAWWQEEEGRGSVAA